MLLNAFTGTKPSCLQVLKNNQRFSIFVVGIKLSYFKTSFGKALCLGVTGLSVDLIVAPGELLKIAIPGPHPTLLVGNPLDRGLRSCAFIKFSRDSYTRSLALAGGSQR